MWLLISFVMMLVVVKEKVKFSGLWLVFSYNFGMLLVLMMGVLLGVVGCRLV